MIRLVVSDIDGTLVPDGSSRIDPEFYGIVRELKKRGIIFAAASGRQYESIRNLLSPVADDVIFIAENGTNVVYCGSHISVNYMDPDLARELILFLRELPGCEIMLATKDYTWLETKDEEFAGLMVNGYKFRLLRTEDLLPLVGQTIKIAAYRRDGIEAVFDRIRERFGGRLNIAVSGEVWADCMSLDADKGNALADIQQQMGITPEETMAFGDNCNDIQMFCRANESYAVANANPLLKRAAKYIAPSCTENGVMRTIKDKLLI